MGSGETFPILGNSRAQQLKHVLQTIGQPVAAVRFRGPQRDAVRGMDALIEKALALPHLRGELGGSDVKAARVAMRAPPRTAEDFLTHEAIQRHPGTCGLGVSLGTLRLRASATGQPCVKRIGNRARAKVPPCPAPAPPSLRALGWYRIGGGGGGGIWGGPPPPRRRGGGGPPPPPRWVSGRGSPDIAGSRANGVHGGFAPCQACCDTTHRLPSAN